MKETISYWKKKVWTVFSLFIRLKYANKKGYSRCVTCGKLYFYKRLQAGHFIPGRHNAVLFNEDVVYPQCYSCNFFLYGNPRGFDKFMRDKYGDEKVKEFDKLAKGLRGNTKQFTIKELEELYKHYKKESDKLLKNLGNYE